jgi:hypothetical protein
MMSEEGRKRVNSTKRMILCVSELDEFTVSYFHLVDDVRGGEKEVQLYQGDDFVCVGVRGVYGFLILSWFMKA